MKTKHLVHIMVFGLAASGGDVLLRFIFLHSLRLNIEAKMKYLEKEVLFWIDNVVAGRPYVWH